MLENYIIFLGFFFQLQRTSKQILAKITLLRLIYLKNYLVHNGIFVVIEAYRYTTVSYGVVFRRLARCQRLRVTIVGTGSLVLPDTPPVRGSTCKRHHQHAPRDGEFASNDDGNQEPLQFPKTAAFLENSF